MGETRCGPCRGFRSVALLFFYILEVDVFALRAVDFLLALFGTGVPGGASALRAVLTLAAECAAGRAFVTSSEKEARDESPDHLDKSQQGDEEDDEKYNQ